VNLSFSNSNCPRLTGRHLRHGFTLVELLLVIMVMAVLAAMSWGVMRSATEDAKVAATRARIAQIEAMLQIEFDNYEVRRLPITQAEMDSVGGNRVALRDLRRRKLAQIIKDEMSSGQTLYQILSRLDRDGLSGVEALGNAAVSRINNVPQVVDAWGRPLELRVLQVRQGQESTANWNIKSLESATLYLPQGYEVLNPSIPRSIDQIRFQVFSRSPGAGQ